MDSRPNILFIMTDDHAAQAIGAYGSRVNVTPNLDRIANEGMRFDHCYVTNSICTPSRATILTGTHNHVHRVMTLATHIDNRLPNVAKHLRTGGYQSAITGSGTWGRGRRTGRPASISGASSPARGAIRIRSSPKWRDDR